MTTPAPEPRSTAEVFETEAEARARIARASRRGFLGLGVGALAAWGGWTWLRGQSQVDGIAWPFRRVHEWNEAVWTRLLPASPARLAREYPRTQAREPRVNGGIGLEDPVDLSAWRLRVSGPAGEQSLSLADLKAMPRVESTTELKCVEGWSQVVTWAGVRLADVAEATGLASRGGGPVDPDRPDALTRYAALATPDAAYYVGLDIASALHPQTLLAYEMNGAPLTPGHGAPLRLAIPVKYGIKNLKRIGTLRFTDDRPADFWAERGYDWYAGL